jgi:N-acetylglucosaminyldiphosphoundecaprenol N-acetyl-beta-D-mannosaminyltransferase
MIDQGKRNILGVLINAIDYEAAVTRILAAAVEGHRCTTSALAVHGVMTGVLDRRHRHRLNHLDLVVPDGQPVRWAVNALYSAKLGDRVYGPKLTLLLCRAAAETGIPVFFYGSRQEVVHKLCDRMRELCPGLVVAGSQPSQFRRLEPDEQTELVETVRASGARIVFVGLGCPRQEVFAYEMGSRLNLPLIAVGAAFDYYSGLLREPPEAVQRAGLQWLYRLIQEPRRLWRRYLVQNTQFVALFGLQALGLWRPDPAHCEEPPAELLYG